MTTAWHTKALAEVADIIRGVTYAKGDLLSHLEPEAVPLLRATNLAPGAIDYEDLVYVPRRIVKDSQLLQEGDILVASSSGSESVVGKNARVTDERLATFGAFCTIIRSTSIDSRYLSLYLQSPKIRSEWSAKARGSNINNLKSSDVTTTQISFPPLEQQLEIVERIESALAKLETSGNQIDEVLLRLEDARRATLRDAFEPAEAIPKRDWQETSLGDVVSIGRRKPSELKDSHDEVSFLPMVAVEEISGVLDQSERISHFAAQQKTLTYFVEGDVLFAKVTPCMENGKVALAKNLHGGCGYGSTEFFPVVPSDRIRGDFLRYFLLNNKFREEAARSMTGAVGLKRVPKTFIESYPIYLPPIGQQERIVQKLEESLSALGALRSTAIDVRKNISLIKRSLLHQAFAPQEESSV